MVERLVVDQDRAEDGLLRLEIVRKRALGCGDVSHGGSGKGKGAPRGKRAPKCNTIDRDGLRGRALLLRHDLHLDLRGDVAMDFHGHECFAQRLQRFRQLDLALARCRSPLPSGRRRYRRRSPTRTACRFHRRGGRSGSRPRPGARQTPRPATSPPARVPRPARARARSGACCSSFTASASLRGSR